MGRSGIVGQVFLALASWCARTGCRRPFSDGATAPVGSWLHTNRRAPPRLLLRRTEFIPLFPFERANRSAGKKRNEFRSTTPRLRVLGKGQNWLMVAHQLASAYQVFSSRGCRPGHDAYVCRDDLARKSGDQRVASDRHAATWSS
jgi:hypothetical protein